MISKPMQGCGCTASNLEEVLGARKKTSRPQVVRALGVGSLGPSAYFFGDFRVHMGFGRRNRVFPGLKLLEAL